MTEIRTRSATGGEKGVKPERYSLMPTKGLAAIARVFGFGASKYADHNWRRRYEWSKSFDALERHFQAAKDGETYDEESGLPHLAHAGFHVLVLLTWLEEDGEGADNPFDDRWPALMERVRRAEEAERPRVHPFDDRYDPAVDEEQEEVDTSTPPPIGACASGGIQVDPDLPRKRRPRFAFGGTLTGEAAQAYVTNGRLKD